MVAENRIPYAIGNFEGLIEGEYFFVDKTGYIRALENYKVPVFLRPRRFGKSLWCSILECYYDVSRRERFEELFGQFDIGREPTPERNSFLVMRFDFSTVQVEPAMEGLRESFERSCRVDYEVFLVHYAEYFEGADLIRTFVIYTVGNTGFRCFETTSGPS